MIRLAYEHGIFDADMLQPPQSLGDFLEASSVAWRGTQRGSKHGAVIATPSSSSSAPTYSNVPNYHQSRGIGWNHCMTQRSSGAPRKLQFIRKVIHAEVHSLLSLEASALGLVDTYQRRGEIESSKDEEAAVEKQNDTPALRYPKRTASSAPPESRATVTSIPTKKENASRSDAPWSLTDLVQGKMIWIVEPTEDGATYEWAHPCPPCTQALTQIGVTQVRYSTPAGIRGEAFRVNPNPNLSAPPYEAARMEMIARGWRGLGQDWHHDH